MGNSSDAASNYSASALVSSLHSTPHYDLKFKAVSHDFEPDSKHYQEALIQMAWPIAILAVLIILRWAAFTEGAGRGMWGQMPKKNWRAVVPCTLFYRRAWLTEAEAKAELIES